MANRTVSLYRKVKTPEGWRRYPAVHAANGKVKPDSVIVAGEEKRFSEGHFELRSFAGAKTVWTRINGGATEALAALKTAQKKAAIKAEAKDANIKIVEDDQRVSLETAKGKYLQAILARGSVESHEVYGRSIDDFLVASGKRYADQISNEDVAAFHVAMRKRGMSDRTISNRHGHIRSFLRYVGLDGKALKDICGTKPRYEKTLPEVYGPAEVKTLFELCNEYDRLLFGLLLRTGLREQEAMHLEWTDISRSKSTLKVQSKPRWGFKVKDAEQREVPLPGVLLKRLMGYREKHKSMKLVFGAQVGQLDVPDGHLLRRLKSAAYKAGLNCGSCEPCVSRNECERWYLHKFRATYITTLIRSGLDLRTVMALSGHSDLASIMRYLRPAEGEEVQTKVNAIKWV